MKSFQIRSKTASTITMADRTIYHLEKLEWPNLIFKSRKGKIFKLPFLDFGNAIIKRRNHPMKEVCENCQNLHVEERKDSGAFSFSCSLDDLVIYQPDKFTCSAFKPSLEKDQ